MKKQKQSNNTMSPQAELSVARRDGTDCSKEQFKKYLAAKVKKIFGNSSASK